jgi:uncharacterized protein with PIN domain
MALVDELVNLLFHFIAIKMNAYYSDQAGSAKTAVNATYAQVSKEAEKLNLGGTMIYVDPVNHLIIFTTPDMDISQSLTIDVVNRNILNVNSVVNA